jgi:site-specific recombinase XerD
LPDLNTTNKHLTDWLTYLDQQGKSSATIAAYRRALQHLMRWTEDTYQEAFVTAKVIPRDLRHWKTYQQKQEKASPATVNQRLTAVSRFFQWARKENLIKDNPTEDIHALRLAERKPQALSDQNVRKLLREAKSNKRDYALLELLIGTGLRVGEVLALQIEDINLNERSGIVIVRHGKGGSYREVPLVLDVRKALTIYLEEEHPRPENPAAPLWINRRGEALSHRSSVMRMLETYVRRSGLEAINPHMLRHTFATRYLKANPDDLRGLARLLGHSSLNTVMIYTEPDFDDLVDRMERMI